MKNKILLSVLAGGVFVASFFGGMALYDNTHKTTSGFDYGDWAVERMDIAVRDFLLGLAEVHYFEGTYPYQDFMWLTKDNELARDSEPHIDMDTVFRAYPLFMQMERDSPLYTRMTGDDNRLAQSLGFRDAKTMNELRKQDNYVDEALRVADYPILQTWAEDDEILQYNDSVLLKDTLGNVTLYIPNSVCENYLYRGERYWVIIRSYNVSETYDDYLYLYNNMGRQVDGVIDLTYLLDEAQQTGNCRANEYNCWNSHLEAYVFTNDQLMEWSESQFQEFVHDTYVDPIHEDIYVPYYDHDDVMEAVDLCRTYIGYYPAGLKVYAYDAD